MVPPEIMSIWQQLMQGLEKSVNRQSYDYWLKPLRPAAYHNKTLLIEVPNHFSRDWLHERYAPLLKHSFETLAGHEVAIKFLLAREVPEVKKYLSRPLDKLSTDLSALNPKYTFDSFVVGNSNRFAHAAAFAVADTPVKAYNPLFLYGGVGLGKTHLMHAIGHHILGNHSRYRIAYVTSERFTNDLINAIKDDQTPQFRSKYRSIDILLIDDIQFLAGKERTQEEFFHTFNSLYEDAKQIVISSDRPPKEIPTLEERLRSRFEWGLITDIQPPDLETRIAILRKKLQSEENSLVPDETILYIADRIQSNIRELEGAFIRVSAYASLNRTIVSPENAAEILKNILPPHKPKQITCSLIQQVVAGYYKLRPEDLKAKKRTRNVAYPRQIAMYLTRELTDLSLPKIGDEFGGRDHTTVLHACEKINQEIQADPSVQEIINELIRRIQKP
ncbi:chromosomal replication initiator protein DnaA [Candidatus Desulforudis audaxviator]|uniref:Chromosomal replication initiator protein DnaA n=1 Tax=Desulforudis audaxviator (strain MP104C) TaxID=477974 RepID=B1I1H4_DESAP|nr:chromosomal replication initiator protein DnaA [Candidatus Desulforudis audaxviator]ACA58570.1 chromosomal replication initiator protein DnaA [Candidatus Desulforudis audaxviator MP104C]AZK58561.1 Chromosomal replication initiator protein DnaA [Candidatus Desulforudis audaxviator]